MPQRRRQQAGRGGVGEDQVVFGTRVQFSGDPSLFLLHTDGTDGGAQKNESVMLCTVIGQQL